VAPVALGWFMGAATRSPRSFRPPPLCDRRWARRYFTRSLGVAAAAPPRARHPPTRAGVVTDSKAGGWGARQGASSETATERTMPGEAGAGAGTEARRWL